MLLFSVRHLENINTMYTLHNLNLKRKKRKIAGAYAGVSVSQILTQREKIGLVQHPQLQQPGQPQQQQHYKENQSNQQIQQTQIWPSSSINHPTSQNRLQGYAENNSNPQPNQQQFFRYQGQDSQQINRVLSGSPMIVGETMIVQPQTSQTSNISQPQIQHAVTPQQLQQHPQNTPNVHISHQQIIGPNGQVISIHGAGPPPPNNGQIPAGSVGQVVTNNGQNNVVIHGQGMAQSPSSQQRIYINGQPTEPSGPGRPNIQMVPISISSGRQDIPQRMQQPFYNQQYQIQQFDPSKGIRPQFNQMVNGFPIHQNPTNQPIQGQVVINHHQQQALAQQQHSAKIWQSRMQVPAQQQVTPPIQSSPNQVQNAFERVPPLHQHTPPPNVWQDEMNRKKVKIGKTMKKRPYIIDQHRIMDPHPPCPNIDVRQIQNDGNRIMINQFQQPTQSASSPSFMEDPSGYLAQQTALLNSTINRQTGANGCSNFNCSSPITSIPSSPQQSNMSPLNSQANGVPLPSNMIATQVKQNHNFTGVNRVNQNIHMTKQHHQIQQQQHIQQQQQTTSIQQQQQQQNVATSQQYNQIMLPQDVADSASDHSQCQGCVADSAQYQEGVQYGQHKLFQYRPDSQPGTPSSSGTGEDPVTSSTYNDKPHTSPDTRPIQGGTVSTSNVSPQEEPTEQISASRNQEVFSIQPQQHFVFSSQPQQVTHQIRENVTTNSYHAHQPKHDGYCPHPHTTDIQVSKINNIHSSGVVTTMASGRTVGSNTITSVLAGRANTATVSINTPPTLPISNNTQIPVTHNLIPTNSIAVNVSKSPLEMVQSVVSSIQVPHSQQMSPHQQHVVKTPSQSLAPGHILVSSGGQLIMANTGNNQHGVMAPPPPKIVTNQGPMPPISVSPMITNVTAAVTQMIPAVAAQQVLGQQTVLVNALPTPFVLQPGVTMTMDGMTVGQNMQIPHLVTGNVIQQQIQLDGSDPRRAPALLSPETKRKGKKRKIPSQTVASMLHIAATQQNSGVVMSQQGFPQQIQMAHSPQSINTQPVMQALTIVPGKAGGPPQIVMNGQPMASAGHLGAQQLITNSQPTQQINLLQPVNLLNGGMVQNFPTIQQFIVPNLGGMVMNADGTATLLQDTSNLGMQLQLQNVNGQNVLTPVQNSNVFNGGQSILTAGPAGMVIRAPGTSQGKIIQQQHSPGAQFLSPNGGQFVVNGAQFSGQLSPLVANVSPSQQVTFGTAAPQTIRPANSVQQGQQEYIQCGQMGQTLMVPCTPAANIAVSSSNQQNTTFVQQNTTIVQQQTTMVSNNQQIQNFQQNNQNNQQNISRTATLNVDQNFIIAANDNKQPVQALLVQRQSPQTSVNYRQSVSTQTAVNQNAQAVTTNTFCQTSTSTASSPPDTTTHSPLASGGQSPPTADTTTHTGSTDDGLSPAPSNCSGSCSDIINLQQQQNRQQSCSMAMVHCISSSEPDSAEMNIQNQENEWSRGAQTINCTPKMEFTDITSVGQLPMGKKPNTPIHMAYAESSTLVPGMHFIPEQIKSHEGVVSSRNYEKMVPKRKHSDTLVVMGTRHIYEDDEESGKSDPKSPHNFVTGDLVWGPAKGCPAWPGKVTQVCDDKVVVRWFGGDKTLTEVDPCHLQTLTEGLDAHHRARKKSRTSRKLNTQLENAIQEAMAELDKVSDPETSTTIKDKEVAEEQDEDATSKKLSCRLRSSNQR
ncbi:hypothetical protein MML48_6g00010088 [Holotrichia oblita]|uniref:Uncharacterized protein n=1 Tax=Holotrichia oblita TaxID=644536 RepID=A0ACB9SZU4_HOLOL|nr:hypothetical protein MML48_6g00010088 [Holotrichia oblita]